MRDERQVLMALGVIVVLAGIVLVAALIMSWIVG